MQLISSLEDFGINFLYYKYAGCDNVIKKITIGLYVGHLLQCVISYKKTAK